MNEIVILSTTDTLDLAKKIASALVEARDAACVNIVSGIRSIYRWEGKINEDAEFLLLIKSTADKFESIRSAICRIHTYQTPEVIALPIAAGDAHYLDWLRESIR
jgi:periplasmic divalent cation tolerance protein